MFPGVGLNGLPLVSIEAPYESASGTELDLQHFLLRHLAVLAHHRGQLVFVIEEQHGVLLLLVAFVLVMQAVLV